MHACLTAFTGAARGKGSEMADITSSVNWLAVIVGFVVAYAAGWLWYGPLFGKAWFGGQNIVMPVKPPFLAMAVQAAGTFLLAWVIGVTETTNALALTILIVATIVVLMIAGGLYSQKRGDVIGIETGYVVAMAVIMVAAQALL